MTLKNFFCLNKDFNQAIVNRFILILEFIFIFVVASGENSLKAQIPSPNHFVVTGYLTYNGVRVPNASILVTENWAHSENPRVNVIDGFRTIVTDSNGDFSFELPCHTGYPSIMEGASFHIYQSSGGLQYSGGASRSGGCNPYIYISIHLRAFTPPLTSSNPQNFGPTCDTESVGAPVNTTNGNMWLRQSDYMLPATSGESIKIIRTYNSATKSSGMFGFGWSNDYDESLLNATSDYPTLRLNTGKIIQFGKLGDNIYAPAAAGFYGQLVKNSNSTYTLTFKDGRIHKFSSSGRLLWQKDRNGNQTTLSYDGSGLLSGITDAFGRAVTITSNQNGTIQQISDSISTIATYEYYPDTALLKAVTYNDGSKYQFEYAAINDKSYLTTVKDALDNILETHEYDSQGRATTSERHGGVEKYIIDYSHAEDILPYTNVTDALGRVTKYYFDKSKGRNVVTKVEGHCGCGSSNSEVTSFEYDSQLNLTKKVDALLNETLYTYDGAGNRLSTTDILGAETYTYNSFGNILTRTDRMGGVTTNTYNTKGNLLTTTDALNSTTILTYTALGQLATVKDALNRKTTLTYDTEGLLTQITDANGKTTNFSYDARARLTSTINALSHTTSFEYDLNNRLNKVIYPDANFIAYTYDLAGRRTAMTDARNNSVIYGYDNAYRLTSVTDALNHTTTFGYDLMSNLTSQTDALSNTTNYEYDDFNRLKKVIYPPATTGAARLEERIEYDTVGNVKKRIDTASRETLYDYDTAHRLIKTTDALNQITQFEYNARSQMTKVKDALNQEYIFTYDALGRRLSQTRAGTTMSYEYDLIGNRIKRTDYKNAVTTYTYDKLNRLKTISYPNESENLTYTYDALSRLQTAVNYAGTINFNYNERDWITRAVDVHNRAVNYTYDANGNRKSLKLDSITQQTYAYDKANRLQKITDAADSSIIDFNYDAANRLTRKILPNGVTTFYQYDGMSRLTRIRDANATGNLFNRQYGYNQANQISQIAEPSNMRNFGYDAIDRLTSATGANVESYSYDAVGNRTASHSSPSYSYQPFNRLTNVAAVSYSYDANGNLISKTDGLGTWVFEYDFEDRLKKATKPTSESVSYKYDALGRRTERSLSSGAWTRFTYDGLDVIKDENSDASTVSYLNGLGIDNKLKQVIGGQAQHFLKDHLGSTRALTDSTGAIISSASYDAFGNSTNNLNTRYQYTGREHDADTGLYYYRARWYDAQIGRFISEDPIGFRGDDINLYGYVWNNPNNFKDALGLFPSRGIWKFHQEIIQDSLNGIATQNQIDILKQEQYDFDKNTQDESYAPWHAMKRVGQSQQSARNEANQFIRNQICLAKNLAKMGFEGESLHYLSRAIHTMQDSNSPAHFDFQEAWTDTGFFSYLRHSDHYVSEALVEPGAAELAREQTKKAWSYYKGANMPKDFFESNLYDSRFGPGFSPSKTSSSTAGGDCECE